jgi:hypothetical protein
MDREEQNEFVKGIIMTLERGLSTKIIYIPDEWDGYELRQWIEDYYHSTFNYIKMDKKRKRNYNNDIITKNLT